MTQSKFWDSRFSNVPCIIHKATKGDWELERWNNIEDFIDGFGSQDFWHNTSEEVGYAGKLTLTQYVDYFNTTSDTNPMYIFDPEVLGNYQHLYGEPELFQGTDFLPYINERPKYCWFKIFSSSTTHEKILLLCGCGWVGLGWVWVWWV